MGNKIFSRKVWTNGKFVTYEIGDLVYGYPTDAGVVKAKIIDFSAIEPYDPIIEFEWGGKTISRRFTFDGIKHIIEDEKIRIRQKKVNKLLKLIS